jgi:Na+/H+-dicarboxylate symporter
MNIYVYKYICIYIFIHIYIYITYIQGTDGTLSCSTAADPSKLATFLLNDVNSVFSSKATTIKKISISDGLINNVFIQMVPSNIVTALGTDNFLGVICFATVFAVACFKMTNRPKAILNLFLEIKKIFMKLIKFIIMLTPFAVVSLVAGALASQADLNKAFLDIG